jgi:hypothetical protein
MVGETPTMERKHTSHDAENNKSPVGNAAGDFFAGCMYAEG